MNEIPVEHDPPAPKTRPVGRQRLLVGVLLGLAVFVGVGIGFILSSDAAATQRNHIIRISHTVEAPTPAVSAALALSDAFTQVTQKVESAVVHIETTSKPTSPGSDIFDLFHRRGRRRHGAGSGVLVDSAGYILTNNHVISDVSAVRVRLGDGRTFVPRIVGVDPETDLAVLQIRDSGSFPFAPIGDSGALSVGDWVLAIGSPFGLEQTVTAGIISAKDRATDGSSPSFQHYLQTDAAINPGNSGGPLVNMKGEVVGINTQISTSTGVYNGVGFAIPSSLVVEVYNQLVTHGRVTWGFMGILLDKVKPEVARVYGLREPGGALIHDVVGADSPAAQAGLHSADIILEYDGHRVRDQHHLAWMVATTEVGRTVLLRVERDGREVEAKVKIGSRASQRQGLAQFHGRPLLAPEAARYRRGRVELGATLASVSPQAADDLALNSTRGALVTEVKEGSLASELGLHAQDVILRFNRQPIRDAEQLRELIKGLGSGDDIVLEVVGPRWGLQNKPGRRILSLVIPSIVG